MSLRWRDAAIQNNMDWYCAECDALGIRYERTESTWYTSRTMPPYHSNLIIANTSDINLLKWLDAKISGDWSIKDVNSTLHLTASGFDKLFNAQWYVRPPGTRLASGAQLLPTRVSSPQQFSDWIALWGETPAGKPVFDPDLYLRSDVGFLACFEGSICGGLAFNHSAQAIGITNTFGHPDGIRACIAEVIEKNPKTPIVGYDRTQELKILMPWGFMPTGPLTVWKKGTP